MVVVRKGVAVKIENVVVLFYILSPLLIKNQLFQPLQTVFIFLYFLNYLYLLF